MTEVKIYILIQIHKIKYVINVRILTIAYKIEKLLYLLTYTPNLSKIVMYNPGVIPGIGHGIGSVVGSGFGSKVGPKVEEPKDCLVKK